MSRATIAHIAQEVGVSVPTVSKVLNGRKDVAPSTRARVEASLQRHNYRRRGAAANTPSAQSNLVELVMHTIETPWSLEIIKGVESVARSQGLGVILTELGGVHQVGRDWLERVLERKPLGVVLVLTDLTDAQRQQLRSRKIPFVVVDTFGEQPADTPTVGSNNWSGGYAAARHLVGHGHTLVAGISGPYEYLCSRARIDGFRSALTEVGVDLDPNWIKWGNFDLEGGYRYGLELLESAERPTAVFAGSDYQAFGVMKAAHDLGLSVPDDVSIIGYDDLPMAEWISPSLTTIEQPLEEMAATAARIVTEGDWNGGELPTRIDLSTQLVERESTAPPPDHIRPGVQRHA